MNSEEATERSDPFGEWVLQSTLHGLLLAITTFLVGTTLGLFGAPLIGASIGLGLAALITAGKYRVVPGTPIIVVRRGVSE